ncbi:MAG TPA: solute carrier family 23 protein [Syntrophorhabdales bacterium]|nr:solute carrier family 23 protein [Syntrophorhabdales bacterium]
MSGHFAYGLDERPPLPELFLLGLQWMAVIIPIVVIIGSIVGEVQSYQPAETILFMRKTAFLIAVTIGGQVLLGHRLPLVAGPATVLVVGVIASLGFSPSAIHTSAMVGGLVLALIAMTGLFAHVRRLFTPRVVALILLLVAFTLAPTIMRLIADPGLRVPVLPRLAFALIMPLLMFFASRHLRGVWKSTLILWSMVAGWCAWALIFPGSGDAGRGAPAHLYLPFFTRMTTGLSFEPGVLFSFLVCFLGLSINDLGSIEAVGELIKPTNLDRRVNRGIALTGLANILAGFLGVVGPVNYSLSPGVIAATGCASRFTLLPTALFMACLACSSRAFTLIGAVPPIVVGSIFLYLSAYQIAAGLAVAAGDAGRFEIEDGLVMGLPLLLGTVVAFMPAPWVAVFPPLLRPIAGNGFVVGVVAVLLLEHVIFRR